MPLNRKKRENLLEILRKLGKLEAEKDNWNVLNFGDLMPEDLVK